MLAGPRISLKFQCEYYVFTLPGLHVHSIVVTPDGKKTVNHIMDIGPYRGVTAADRTENDLHHRR